MVTARLYRYGSCVLSLEQFAKARADIEHRGDLASVLRELQLSRAEWIVIERHWLSDLVAAASSGRTELADQYMSAFIGEAPALEAPAAPQAPITAPRAAPLPSYLAHAAPAAPALTAPALAVAVAPAPPVAAAAPAAAIPPPARLQGTAFASGGPVQAATPFEADDAGMHGISLARYAELSVAAQTSASGASRETMLAAFSLDELRFREVTAHFEAKFAKRASLAMEFQRLMVRAQREKKERSSAEQMPQTQPARALPDPSAATIEWYAAVTVAMASGQQRAAVLQRFSLTEPAWRAVAEAWAHRMMGSTELRAEFDHHIRRLKPRG